MKIMMLLSLIFIVLSGAAAQRKLIQDHDEIVAKAKSELDSSMFSGALKKFALENKITGEYTMDITIHEKGKVLTVFAVSDSSVDVKMQNKLKDFIRTLEFSFKMPAGKPYKFQYIFHFG
jgi:hypothetical protein